MDKEFLSSYFSEFGENFAENVWKIAPFRAGNRMWLGVLVKAYIAMIALCLCLACVLNSLEGEKWVADNLRGDHGVRSTGKTALDECIWFVFTTVHGIGFGEFNARGHWSRVIACGCVSLGYWFTIFVLSIVMLANLPGEKCPSLCGATARVVSAVWPSYLLFLSFVLSVGSMCGPYLSADPYGYNGFPTGMYWMWTTAHRMPYGDIYPAKQFGRTMTVPAAIIGLLYMPYALALVAVRCPTMEQHQSLLGKLRAHPENALGRGYIVPQAANMREVVMEEYTPEGSC